jgi:hypothetical protein
MRNFISTAILCLLVLAGIAQNNDFVFYTDNGDKFTLYLNNVKQNATAATNVKAENISGKSISVRVVFERSGVPTFSRTMSVSSNDKEIKVQLVKGRENVYTMKTVSTTDRHHSSSNNNSTTVVKGSNGSNETKDNGHGGNGGHGNNNGGHGNNNGGHGNNGHGNGGHGNGGYGNNNHGNGGYGNGGYGNGGYGNNGYWNNGYGPTDNPRCHFPMQQNDFNSLRSQVRARYFDSSRMTVAKQACRYNCMTSDQIRDLCKEFAYESNRLDFAKYAFEYCYDRYRYYIVGQAFTYSSSVDQLNRYITNQMANYQQPYGGYNNGGYFQSDNPNCHYIMSDHDFSDLRQMINNTPYSSTKMTIAKQACSATCISAEQVREICRLFTFDSDRLTFAKYAYDHCYDRRNYFKVNEVFTFSSSVSELNRYINQHNY